MEISLLHLKRLHNQVQTFLLVTKKNLKEENINGYTPRLTEETFIVSRIQYTDPLTYKITYMTGKKNQSTFYEQELQKTKQEILRIEQIIWNRGN